MTNKPLHDASGHGDLSDEEVRRRILAMADQFEDIGKTVGGPRDYALKEEDSSFIPPDPGPINGFSWVWVWISTLAVVIIIATALGLAQVRIPLLVSGVMGTIALVSIAMLIRLLPKRRRANDDGAQI